MRHICKGLALGICGLLALLTILLVLPGLFRIHPLIVQSGSMEPVYPVGSVIYVKNVDEAELLEGKPVTFRAPDEETLVTHRIVKMERQDEQLFIYTKGDANELEDSVATPFSHVVGVPFLCIPYLGYLAGYLSCFAGKAWVLSLVVVVCILSWMDQELQREENEVQGG